MDERFFKEIMREKREMLYLKQLELELLETLEITIIRVIGYAKEHQIPIPNEESLASLLRKASAIIEEITVVKSRKLPFRKSSDRDPEELPEPINAKLIGYNSYLAC